MLYDKRRRRFGDGEWHCPFPEWWVMMMKKAAKACEHLTTEEIEAIDRHIEVGRRYNIKPGEFLKEPQDSRGLPLSWCEEEEKRYSNHPTSCGAIYDYDSIPEVVVTNGEDDWPLRIWRPIEAT